MVVICVGSALIAWRHIKATAGVNRIVGKWSMIIYRLMLVFASVPQVDRVLFAGIAPDRHVSAGCLVQGYQEAASAHADEVLAELALPDVVL